METGDGAFAMWVPREYKVIGSQHNPEAVSTISVTSPQSCHAKPFKRMRALYYGLPSLHLPHSHAGLAVKLYMPHTHIEFNVDAFSIVL